MRPSIAAARTDGDSKVSLRLLRLSGKPLAVSLVLASRFLPEYVGIPDVLGSTVFCLFTN